MKNGGLVRLARRTPSGGKIHIDIFSRGLRGCDGFRTPFFPSHLIFTGGWLRSDRFFGPADVKSNKEQQRSSHASEKLFAGLAPCLTKAAVKPCRHRDQNK